MSNLEALRSEIDQLDEKLIELLAERFAVSRRVGKLKRSSVLPPRDEEREQRQLQRVRGLAQAHGVSPELAEAVLRLIVDTVVVEHQEE
ncbi:MAG: chorismate mutase [Gammaproteobacteria bacterium]|nr:MAG: chorismate mutase [Gammaproteobacteria bacterium]